MVLLFITDRLLKLAAQLFGDAAGFFVYSHNSALAFSIPAPLAVITFVIPIITILFIILTGSALAQGKGWPAFGYGSLAVGAFSNLIDRWLYGGVIDYIQIWILPVFNIADVMIVAGLLVLFFRIPSGHPGGSVGDR